MTKPMTRMEELLHELNKAFDNGKKEGKQQALSIALKWMDELEGSQAEVSWYELKSRLEKALNCPQDSSNLPFDLKPEDSRKGKHKDNCSCFNCSLDVNAIEARKKLSKAKETTK